MSYINGTDRSQLGVFPLCYEEMIDKDNPVRAIDLFVNIFNFKELGFRHSITVEEGRSPFRPQDLMKLYVYGYLNGIRSSRKLARECNRNIEVMWLLGGLTPSFKTISAFRGIHSKQIKSLFREFVAILQGWNLIDGELVAIDGSKFRAVNASKNNFNEAKIGRQLDYIDGKIEQYLKDLDTSDKDEKDEVKLDVKTIKTKLKTQQLRKQKYEELLQELKQSGETQISTTDKDARSMPINHKRIEVSYNVQTATDSKHCLIVHYEATNVNDHKAMFGMALATKEILKKDELEVVLDKGYHNGEQIYTCGQNNIVTYVAVPETARPKTLEVPTPEYFGEKFIYNKEEDTFTCPQNQTLTTNGNWYPKHYDTPVKHYKTNACLTCAAMSLCTMNKRGRLMERSFYAEAVEANKARVTNEKKKYLLRQQIVEHPFGTIKRQWGFDHTLLMGLKKVEADFGLVFTAYNLRRLFTILGQKGLKKLLMKLFPDFFHYLIHSCSLWYQKYFRNRVHGG